jgi:hypothetical protein
MYRHYTCGAGLIGEVRSLGSTCKNGLEACVCQAFLGAVKSVGGWVANGHSESLDWCQSAHLVLAEIVR